MECNEIGGVSSRNGHTKIYFRIYNILCIDKKYCLYVFKLRMDFLLYSVYVHVNSMSTGHQLQFISSVTFTIGREINQHCFEK